MSARSGSSAHQKCIMVARFLNMRISNGRLGTVWLRGSWPKGYWLDVVPIVVGFHWFLKPTWWCKFGFLTCLTLLHKFIMLVVDWLCGHECWSSMIDLFSAHVIVFQMDFGKFSWWWKFIMNSSEYLPVVPHKAVAEVSGIANYRRVSWCDARMAERTHWWIERWLEAVQRSVV